MQVLYQINWVSLSLNEINISFSYIYTIPLFSVSCIAVVVSHILTPDHSYSCLYTKKQKKTREKEDIFTRYQTVLISISGIYHGTLNKVK